MPNNSSENQLTKSSINSSFYYRNNNQSTEHASIWGSWDLKVQQTEAHSTRLRISSPEFYLIMQKSFYLGKVITLKVFWSYIHVHYGIE